MLVTSEFVVGSHYSNDQISMSLRVENLGGIRPSLGDNRTLRHLAVMTNTQQGKKNRAENPYHDRIEGSILVYTASGRKGDQTLTGRNKRGLEQYETPVPIFGFTNQVKTSHYTRVAVENAIDPQKQFISLLGGKQFVAIVLRSGVNLEEFRYDEITIHWWKS